MPRPDRDLEFLTTLDFGLLPLLEGQAAQALALFFALDPQVNVPYHVTHEHLAVVALRSHQQIAEGSWYGRFYRAFYRH